MVAVDRNKNRKDRNRRRRGFSLIEIMVVVTIIGLLMGLVGVAVINQLQDARVETAKNQILQIGQALDHYYLKFGRYPSTAEGVSTLSSPPGGVRPIMEKIPKDPWGHDYVYMSPGQHNSNKYDLESYGPDGTDSSDDVESWNL